MAVQCRDADPEPRPRHIRRVAPEWGVAAGQQGRLLHTPPVCWESQFSVLYRAWNEGYAKVRNHGEGPYYIVSK